METKKGLVQLKEKYKERIAAWKELQKRGCAGELSDTIIRTKT